VILVADALGAPPGSRSAPAIVSAGSRQQFVRVTIRIDTKTCRNDLQKPSAEKAQTGLLT